VQAGRFVVHGSHDRGRFSAERIAIEINAGLAFGTGHHGSTRGCLLALDRVVKVGRRTRRAKSSARIYPRRHGAPMILPTRRDHRKRASGLPASREKKAAVLDLGTGSGVLAIAAAKRLRQPVLAGDLDRRAVAIARDNARMNGVGPHIEVVHAAGLDAARFDARAPFNLVLANILLEPLLQFATRLAALVAPNGHVVLSGLLNSQARPALVRYRGRAFIFVARITLGGWTTLVLRRKGRLR
jgi:ribosomal protein L11 methyltransferase